MQSDIEKIINDGVMAPSGENCQPWRFELYGNKLSIFNVPEADQSLYNSKQKGSYIAHGALIENISISAMKYGYTISVSLFPTNGGENHVAEIIFTAGSVVIDPLYDSISLRCTNRKDFTGEKLSEQEKSLLLSSILTPDINSLVLVDDETKMSKLGQALAVNERVLFENKYIHDFFYEHIIWDKKDEDKAGGFFIDTLEFLPHQLKAVKLLKHWYLLKILNIIPGVSKIISKENGEKYAKSGTFGAILMKGDKLEDYVNTGRSMQRLWLSATKLGIAMHPCNGTIYFMDQINDNGGKEFSTFHKDLIKSSFEDIVQIFGSGDSRIGFIFRIGKAGVPSVRSKREKPVIVYK